MNEEPVPLTRPPEEKLPWPKDKDGRKLPAYTIAYYPDGEIFCRLNRASGEYVPDELRTVPLIEMMKGDIAAKRYKDGMWRFYEFLKLLKQHAPKRQIPILKSEFLANIGEKGLLKKLCEAQLLKDELITFVKADTRASIGKRAVVYFTPQGRAFIREHIDPQYALTENV